MKKRLRLTSLSLSLSRSLSLSLSLSLFLSPPLSLCRSPPLSLFLAHKHTQWSRGLTPAMLRDNWDDIVGLARKGGSALAVERCVARIVQEAHKDDDDDASDAFFFRPLPAFEEGSTSSVAAASTSASAVSASTRRPTFDILGQVSGIAVGSRRAGRPPECWEHFDAVLAVTVPSYFDDYSSEMVHGMDVDGGNRERGRAEYLHLPVAEGKRDRTKLIQALPLALVFILTQIARGRRVLIHCNQGQDRSVGVATAAIALFCIWGSHDVIPRDWCKGEAVSWAGFEQFAGTATRQTKNTNSNERCDGQSTDEEDLVRARCARLLFGPSGKSLFFAWIQHLRSDVITGTAPSPSLPSSPAWPDKAALRQALSVVTLFRGLANPSRFTMRKLSRFFTRRKSENM
jgi:protein-tyrosine phosphatase